MSAVLQPLPPPTPGHPKCHAGWREGPKSPRPVKPPQAVQAPVRPTPSRSMAFYRKHTEKLLRRYLYASIMVGRSPSILDQEVTRGWSSVRRLTSFEDSVIFVIDIEKCLDRLDVLERQLIGRIVLQEYSHSEASLLLGISSRYAYGRYTLAMDRLTEILINKGLLSFPQTT